METLLKKIESYNFECEAGPLTNCVDWHELQSQLTTAQAHIALLREALKTISVGLHYPASNGPEKEAVRISNEALAIPNDDAALLEWGARLLDSIAGANVADDYISRASLFQRAAELRSGE